MASQNPLTVYQLRMFAKKWLKETYNMDLTVPLSINGRLKTACGRFVYQPTNAGYVAKGVEMNRFFVENHSPEIVLDVLRHELVHYALFMLDKPNSDGHPVFEGELSRLGIVSQSTISKYQITSKPKPYHRYQCENEDCGKIFTTARALAHKGVYHRCKCGGRLIDLGKKAVSA